MGKAGLTTPTTGGFCFMNCGDQDGKVACVKDLTYFMQWVVQRETPVTTDGDASTL